MLTETLSRNNKNWSVLNVNQKGCLETKNSTDIASDTAIPDNTNKM